MIWETDARGRGLHFPRSSPLRRDKVALTGFMRYFICRVVLKKLTSSTFVSYYLTLLSYISIKFSDNVLS